MGKGLGNADLGNSEKEPGSEKTRKILSDTHQPRSMSAG